MILTYNKLIKLNLCNLIELTELYLNNNQLSIINLSKLENIKHLNISNNEITKIKLHKMNKLYYLDISNNQITKLNFNTNIIPYTVLNGNFIIGSKYNDYFLEILQRDIKLNIKSVYELITNRDILIKIYETYGKIFPVKIMNLYDGYNKQFKLMIKRIVYLIYIVKYEIDTKQKLLYNLWYKPLNTLESIIIVYGYQKVIYILKLI